MRLSLVAACLLAAAGTAWADGPSTAEQTVDAMNKVWGKHAGFRANHAKGIVTEGSFSPAPEAAALSTASLFKGGAVPVTVRFSDATGVPDLPDGSPYANPHGMAVKFHLAGGGEMDVVTNSLKFFPVSTGEDFLSFFQAVLDSGPDSPKPTKFDQFIAGHPTVPAALATIATPSSLAHESYYGVDAFVFIDAAGKRQPFRVQFVPQAGVEHIPPADAAKQAPDYLMDELPARLAKGPVLFTMVAHLANPGDQTKDPAQPWPDDRRTVTLGTITITSAVADSAAAQKKLLFLPTRLTPGIEISDDPLIRARSAAYAVSFSRRLR